MLNGGRLASKLEATTRGNVALKKGRGREVISVVRLFFLNFNFLLSLGASGGGAAP